MKTNTKFAKKLKKKNVLFQIIPQKITFLLYPKVYAILFFLSLASNYDFILYVFGLGFMTILLFSGLIFPPNPREVLRCYF